MRNDTITLIKKTGQSNDAYGRQIIEETQTEIFCDVQSIRQTEFTEAGKLGIRPAFCFEIFAEEYNGEEEVEYLNRRFYVYRTYRNRQYPDRLELYVQDRSGVKNG